MGLVGFLIGGAVMAGILSALQQGLQGLRVGFQVGKTGVHAADDAFRVFPLCLPLAQRVLARKASRKVSKGTLPLFMTERFTR